MSKLLELMNKNFIRYHEL